MIFFFFFGSEKLQTFADQFSIKDLGKYLACNTQMYFFYNLQQNSEFVLLHYDSIFNHYIYVFVKLYICKEEKTILSLKRLFVLHSLAFYPLKYLVPVDYHFMRFPLSI